MLEGILIGLSTLVNAGCAALAWRAFYRADRARRDADHCGYTARAAQNGAKIYAEQAKKSADEAKRLAVRDMDNQVRPFTPAEGWHKGDGESFQ